MKTSRLELRLDPELRAKLEALARASGKSASSVVRRLVLRAYREAFGDPRPAPGATAPAPARTAREVTVAAEFDALES